MRSRLQPSLGRGRVEVTHSPETSALMMRRDDQTNDHDDHSRRKYQDHREDVLEDPVLACYPLPVLRRHLGLGRVIAGGRIVQ